MAKGSDVPWLDREHNGVYYAFWYDKQNGRSRRLSLGTRETVEAQRRFAAFLIEHNDGDAAQARDKAGQTLTVGMALDAYFAEHRERNRKLDPHAPEIYAARNIEAFFGVMPVAGITEDLIHKYTDRRSDGTIGKPSTAGTHIRELTVLRAAINHAVRRKRISATDAPAIIMPQKPEPRDRWLSHDELAALLAAAQGDGSGRLPRIYRFVTMAYHTAARRSAVRELQWFQIDRDTKKIRLNPAGRRQTRKRRPVVPIFAELEPIVERAWAERQGPFWLDHSGSIRTAFDTVARRAGLEDVSPHVLRHTRAVHLAQSGVSLYTIAGLLGDTLTTVERNYLHHCPDHIRAEIERLNGRAEDGQNLGRNAPFGR